MFFTKRLSTIMNHSTFWFLVHFISMLNTCNLFFFFFFLKTSLRLTFIELLSHSVSVYKTVLKTLAGPAKAIRYQVHQQLDPLPHLPGDGYTSKSELFWHLWLDPSPIRNIHGICYWMKAVGVVGEKVQ